MQKNAIGQWFKNHHITPWVAMVIVGVIAAITAIWVWTVANDSWIYGDTSTRYPRLRKTISKVVSAIDTVGWKSYRDDGYGFIVRHPSKYQKTVGNIVGSVLGTTKNPVFGASVGPLVFVKAEDPNLRKAAEQKFLSYWNSDQCIKKAVNTGLDIKAVFCLVNNAPVNYALARGKSFDIFIDGFSGGSAELIKAYGLPGTSVSQAEMLAILSTFSFTTTDPGGACAQVITPARNPETGEVKNFPTPCDVPEGWITNLIQ